ncbi:3-oxoacyl-ACP synthase [Haliscomenobacter sp.]|uniref:3-oxoacyl-ACP synthase n=1 Tax=Haliscomenobacter sp. TaxID=2717303 RepID=UPI003364D543
MIAFKTALHQACLNRIDQRIVLAQKAMEDIQESANQETKSSAGDKYETSRAMMQQEKDKHADQLDQAKELRRQLELLDPTITPSQIQPGSLVQTNEGQYYLSVSLGKMLLDNQTVFVLSAAAPLGQALLHKRIGDKIVFQNRSIEILEIS